MAEGLRSDEEATDSQDLATFSLADYLQLSCMARRSVRLCALRDGKEVGGVIVASGEIWRAWDEFSDNNAAFRRLALRDVEVRVEPLIGELGERTVFGNWERLMMDAAIERDESERRSSRPGGPRPTEAPANSGTVRNKNPAPKRPPPTAAVTETTSTGQSERPTLKPPSSAAALSSRMMDAALDDALDTNQALLNLDGTASPPTPDSALNETDILISPDPANDRLPQTAALPPRPVPPPLESLTQESPLTAPSPGPIEPLVSFTPTQTTQLSQLTASLVPVEPEAQRRRWRPVWFAATAGLLILGGLTLILKPTAGSSAQPSENKATETAVTPGTALADLTDHPQAQGNSAAAETPHEAQLKVSDMPEDSSERRKYARKVRRGLRLGRPISKAAAAAAMLDNSDAELDAPPDKPVADEQEATPPELMQPTPQTRPEASPEETRMTDTSPKPASPESSPPTSARPSVPAQAIGISRTRILGFRMSGPPSAAGLSRKVAAARGAFASCYRKAAKIAGKNGFGRVRVQVTINARGRATSPNASGGLLPGLNRCIASVAGRISSRPQPGMSRIKLTWTVDYSP